MKSSRLVNLLFSPQLIAKIFHHFLTGVQEISQNGIKTELIHLVIPFVIDDDVRPNLLRANLKSTFFTILQKEKSLKIHTALAKKNNQILEYRKFTNRGLIYLGNMEHLKIDRFIKIDNTINYKSETQDLQNYCKAAYYLGILFAKEDYRNIFIKLGVTNL